MSTRRKLKKLNVKAYSGRHKKNTGWETICNCYYKFTRIIEGKKHKIKKLHRKQKKNKKW